MNISDLIPCDPYFLIRIGKVEQKDKKEKVGSLYFPSQFAFMRRELQYGEIISIGKGAQEFLPEASIGDFLLCHHFTTGKSTDKGYNFYKVEQDDDYNYYVVNAYEIPGERPLCYGVYANGKLIPTPDYIFLELRNEDDGIHKSESGLYMVKQKQKSREEWSSILKKNMDRIKQLARNIPYNEQEYARMNKEIMKGALDQIKVLEAENLRISKMLNKKRYDLFKVLALNDKWHLSLNTIDTGKEISFKEDIQPGDMVYMLDIACRTTIEAFGKEFVVAESKYFTGSLKLMQNVVRNFNSAPFNCLTPAKETTGI